MSIADLISQGYGGYQGWNDEAAAAADFAATGGAGKWTGGGGNSGGSVPSVPAGVSPEEYNKLLGAIPSSMEQAEKLQTPIDELLNQYVLFRRSQPQMLDIFKQFETEAGLPEQRKIASDIRSQIYSIEDILAGIEAQIAGTSRESLLTESQRQQLVQAKREPYLEKFTRLTTGLGRVEEGLAASADRIKDLTSLVREDQDRETQLFAIQLDAFSERAARLQSGFDIDRQTKLEVYLERLKRQEALSDQEREDAFTLLRDEQAFNRSLAELRESAKLTLEGATAQQKLDISKYWATTGVDKTDDGGDGAEGFYNDGFTADA